MFRVPKSRLLLLVCLLLLACGRSLDLPGPLPTLGYLGGRLVEAQPGTDQTLPVAQGTISIPNTNFAAISDAAGHFSLGPLPKGTYKLLLQDPLPAAGSSGKQRQRLFAPATVTAGATNALGDISLQENAVLLGRVLAGGQPTGNLGTIVSVPGTEFSATTADSGAWVLRQLPEGTLRVSAYRPGFKPVTTSDLQLRGATVTAVVDLVLLPEAPAPSRLHGSVQVLGAPDGSGVVVKAISNTAQKVVGTQTTAADGAFAFGGLAPDVYTLSAELAGRPLARVPNLTLGAGVDVPLDPILLGAGPTSGSAQCTAATQCAPGQLCSGNVCTDCSSSPQCGAGSSCTGGRCQRDCASNADCPGQVCAAGRCRACADGTECMDPSLACVAGQCAHCRPGQSDCAQGQACLAAGCGACAQDGDCGAGATCSAGVCVPGACGSNEGCPLSQACLANQCGSCSADGQCRTGQLCISGSCVTGDCRATAQCPPGQVCNLGAHRCGACGIDGDCGAGNLCLPTAVGNRCARGNCRLTADCRDANLGQVCLGNTCTDCGSGVGCAGGQICAPQAGGALRCVLGNCVLPSDCNGAESGWLCSSNSCLPCALDADCAPLGSNLICSQGACAAAQCGMRADCKGPNAGLVCRQQRCAACAPGDCNAGEQCTGGLCVVANLFTVSVTTSGSGAVSSTPGTISCTGGSGTCASVFVLGDQVTLTASPAAGFFFGGWSGVVGCGAAPSCRFVVAGNTSVTAAFNAGATIAVALAGPGTVTSSPAALSCPGTCSAAFAIGSAVTLGAVPVAGFSFAGWSGGGCGGAGPCAVTVAQATTITATFVRQPVLAVAPAGSGSGTITSSPAGLNCSYAAGVPSGQCSAPFPAGTRVTLTEAPAGSPFGGWLSGGCSGTATTCAVTLAADTTVGAAFGTAFALTLTVTGPGAVSADSGAVANCSGAGGTCSGSYAAGTAVRLTATPQPGAALGAWGGDCSAASGAICTLSMSQARAPTATFTPVTALSTAQGDQQSSTAGALLASSVVIQVSGVPGGLPIASAPVSLAGPPGSVVTPATANTDASGKAVFGVRLARTLGAQAFTATTPTAATPLNVTATASAAAAGLISTLVDIDLVGGSSGIPGPGVPAHVNNPTGLALSADGTLFVAAYFNNQVYALSPAGVLALVAGTGTCGHAGDLGPAAAAQLCGPLDLALDETHGRRTLYVVDGSQIRAIDLTASPPAISTFAGGGSAAGPGYGDGGPAASAALSSPRHLAVDPAGTTLAIADNGINRFRRVDLSTRLISAWLSVPSGVICGPSSNCSFVVHDCLVAFDRSGTPWVGWDPLVFNNCNGGGGGFAAFRVGAGGATTQVAGGGASTSDGAPALSAAFAASAGGMLFDAAGNLFVVERLGHRIRRVEMSVGRVTTIVGAGSAGFSGELTPAKQALLNNPWTAVIDANQNLAFTDGGNNTVREIWAAGSATAAAPTLVVTSADPQSVVVDQPAAPFSVQLLDPAGQPLPGYGIGWSITDPGGALVNTTSTTNLSGVATTLARAGLLPNSPYRFTASYTPPAAAAPAASTTLRLNAIAPAAGSMFSIADVDHLAGGDGFPGAATRAHVNAPTGLAAAKDGTLFFADNVNNQVFALSPAGLLSVVAGTGACGHAGDGGPAAAAQLCAPLDVALDETHGRRTLYVVDGPVIRALDLTAAPPSINLFAGGGSAPGPGYGDGSAASFAALNSPQHVSVDPSGSFVYIVDNGSGRFRRVDLSNGNINAWLSVPPNVICTSSNCSAFQHDCALGFDAMGTPYVSWTPYFSNGCNGGSSSGGGTVFRVAPDLSTTPIAGGGSNGGEGVPATNALLSPVISQLFFDPGGSLYLLERSNHRVRKLSDLTAAATIKTVIGTGASGNGADFAAPTATALSSPWAIEVLASGAMVVSDTNNAALRAIWPPYP